MKLMLCVATLWFSCVWGHSTIAAPELSVVTQLDFLEPFDAMAFHDGHLWVGKSRKNHDLFYSVELYDTDSKLLSSVMLKHRADHLYPYGPDSVLVMGITPYPTHSRYSIIKRVNQQIRIVEEKEYPQSITTDRFAGVINNTKYFTVPGGPLEGMDEPRESILAQTGTGYRFLKPTISYPGSSAIVGNKLLIVEEGGLGSEVKNLLTIDLFSQMAKRLFPAGNRNGLGQTLMLNSSLAAVTEFQAGRVIIVNTETSRVEKEIKIAAGTPRSIAKLGKCLVIGSDFSKKISIVKWQEENTPLIAEWDLSPLGTTFFRLSSIAVDEKNKSVYARSSFPCNPFLEKCIDERNSVVKAKALDDSLAVCGN